MTGTGAEVRGFERAAATLTAARRVLVTGFAHATADTAAIACDLAEELGAAVDPGWSDCGQVAGPTIVRMGAVTADAAELQDRADLVVVWFCDSARAAAFLERFAGRAMVSRGRRRTIVVGHAPDAPAGGEGLVADRSDAVSLARLLHAAVAGIVVPVPSEPLASACRTLSAAIEAAACVAFVTCHDDPVGLEPWSLAGLVRVIAHRKPAFEVPLADEPGDAAAVCTWRYGAAGAIARADRLGGEFLPGECDALRLVERGEVDCVVAAGPLAASVEAAIAARGEPLALIRVDDGSLVPLLAAVRARRTAGGSP